MKLRIDAYFSDSLDGKIQIFNMLMFTCLISGIGIAFTALAIGVGVVVFAIHLFASALSYAMLRVAEKTQWYRACSRVIVALLFFVAFPALFFFCGGYKSGAAYPFLIAVIFTALLLEGRERIAVLAAEMILYVACCMIAYYMPDTPASLPTEFDYAFVTVVNLTTVSAVLVAVLLIRNHIITRRQAHFQELNRELMARNETLAQYDSMKSDFLATVAHEINTPLAIISASSSDTIDLLEESPLDVDEIIENQMVIARRVKIIDSILLDLMDTVAIEKGRLPLYRQPSSLLGLVKGACDAQAKVFAENGNQIIYELQEGLPKIWLDPSRIEQVVTNMLSNALRYTKDGEVTVRLKAGGEGEQTVSVQDNGEGMDADLVNEVFKRYVSTKTDYWRHGIGLYICRRIINAHGGDIWIDSEKGRGTTISFRLREDPEYE